MPAHELTARDHEPRHNNSDDWAQLHIRFTDWHHAEHTAARYLRPLLTTDTAGWWFIRKYPCWRLRYRSADDAASRRLAEALDNLAASGTIHACTPTIYEPETHAFGGPAAMDLAHELFHHDSRTVLDVLHTPPTRLPGRRELTVVAVSLLLRRAGLDWYEQGDVWAKVADLRRSEHAPPPVAEHAPTSLRRLMTVDAGPTSPLLTAGPLAPLTDWLAAFEHTGQQLALLAHHGTLRRGLRATLSHHIIFHWNRLGLTHHDQLTLATLARDIVMSPPTSEPT